VESTPYTWQADSYNDTDVAYYQLTPESFAGSKSVIDNIFNLPAAVRNLYRVGNPSPANTGLTYVFNIPTAGTYYADIYYFTDAGFLSFTPQRINYYKNGTLETYSDIYALQTNLIIRKFSRSFVYDSAGVLTLVFATPYNPYVKISGIVVRQSYGEPSSTATFTATKTNTAVRTATPSQTKTITVTSTTTPSMTLTPHITATNTWEPTPTGYRVRCGSTVDYTDRYGRVWYKDQLYTSGNWGWYNWQEPGGVVNLGSVTMARADDSNLYNTYRYNYNGYVYHFYLPTPGIYRVTIKTSSLSTYTPHNLNIYIEQTPVVTKDLSVSPGIHTAYDYSCSIPVTDTLLTVDLRNTGSAPGYANAIEVEYSGNTRTQKNVIDRARSWWIENIKLWRRQ
jgi:hypothetical protein